MRGGVLTVGLVAALVSAASVSAHGGKSALVHACVSGSGTVRIVGPSTRCRSGERALDWARSRTRGARGAPGTPGPPGARGPTGTRGPAGVQGVQGERGATGASGNGVPGAKGATGAAGATGPSGTTGATGTKGPAGSSGPTGLRGPTGSRGPTGEAGPAGAKGTTGVRGTTGLRGATGTKGTTGTRGPTGAKGATGSTGTVSPLARALSIPLASFIDCQTDAGAFLDFVSDNDAIPDFRNTATDGLTIQFDAISGSPDQNSEICSQLLVPPDWVSGGSFLVRATKTGHSSTGEQITCGASVNGAGFGTAGGVLTTSAASTLYTCTPTLLPAAGSSISFYLSITPSSGSINDAVDVQAVAFRYTSQQ